MRSHITATTLAVAWPLAPVQHAAVVVEAAEAEAEVVGADDPPGYNEFCCAPHTVLLYYRIRDLYLRSIVSNEVSCLNIHTPIIFGQQQ